jgi:hypothetical protein
MHKAPCVELYAAGLKWLQVLAVIVAVKYLREPGGNAGQSAW